MSSAINSDLGSEASSDLSVETNSDISSEASGETNSDLSSAINRDVNIGESAIRQRISELYRMSRDPYFDQYLDRLLAGMDRRQITPAQAAVELERTYRLYQVRMNRPPAAVPPPVQQSQVRIPQSPVPPPVQQSQVRIPQSPVPPRQPRQTPSSGAGLLSIIVAAILMIAFNVIGLNYLTGVIQGIFLYFMTAVIMLLTESGFKRKAPQFTGVVNSLGFAGMYAATMVNYWSLHSIRALTAVIIILVLAANAIIIGKRINSSGVRLAGFIGCYVSFLPFGSFNGPGPFFAATGVLTLINLAGILLPNREHQKMLWQVHMLINTLFTIFFALLAADGAVHPLYIIFFITMNIVLLNIVYLKQEHKGGDTAWFGIELGVLELLILGMCGRIFTDGIFTGRIFTDGQLRLFGQVGAVMPPYYRVIILSIVLAGVLAVGIFFAALSRDKNGRTLQYYNFMIFALLLIGGYFVRQELVWGGLILFITVKLFFGVKEWEAMNGIVTVFAFVVGLVYYNYWPSWLLFVAFCLSIMFIRRRRLFYQYLISLFLLIFTFRIAVNFDIFHLCAAMILFGLVPAFHYLRLTGGEERNTAAGLTEKIYNISNFCAMMTLSLLTGFTAMRLTRINMLLLGALYIVLYVRPRLYPGIKNKKLLLAGYLVYMTFMIYLPPLLESMILMAIAVACIVGGFKDRPKILRRGGLILAIFAGAKIFLFDLQGAGLLPKIFILMITGIVLLIISFNYIKAEKGQNTVPGLPPAPERSAAGPEAGKNLFNEQPQYQAEERIYAEEKKIYADEKK